LIQDKDNSDPSGISRGHEVFVSDDGLITIAGGKLTDYRGMAEDTFVEIDKKWKEQGISYKKVDTKTIPLSGGDVEEEMEDFIASKRQVGITMGLKPDEA